MPMPFEPRWHVAFVDAAPDDPRRRDARPLVARLRALGFQPTGDLLVTSVSGVAGVKYAEDGDNDEIRRAVEQGEVLGVLHSADGRTYSTQTDLHSEAVVRFWSLSGDGTVWITTSARRRHPEVVGVGGEEGPAPSAGGTTGTSDPALRAAEEAADRWVGRVLAAVVGKTDAGLYPSFPRAGVRRFHHAQEVEALWASHRGHLAEAPEVVDVRDRRLQLAVRYRVQHADLHHIGLFPRASALYDGLVVYPLTWLVPPLLLAWLGLGALGFGLVAVWLVFMWWFGMDLLRMVQTYWVLTPILRWSARPARVSADELVATYTP